MFQKDEISFSLEESKDGAVNVFPVINGRKIEMVYFDFIAAYLCTKVMTWLDPFTCSCGEAGCAGYSGYVVSKISEDKVIWECIGSPEEAFGKETLVFDRTAFTSALETLRSDITARANAGGLFTLLSDWDLEDDDETAETYLDPHETFEGCIARGSSEGRLAMTKELLEDLLEERAAQRASETPLQN